jgi:hypothetical protein
MVKHIDVSYAYSQKCQKHPSGELNIDDVMTLMEKTLVMVGQANVATHYFPLNRDHGLCVWKPEEGHTPD